MLKNKQLYLAYKFMLASEKCKRLYIICANVCKKEIKVKLIYRKNVNS